MRWTEIGAARARRLHGRAVAAILVAVAGGCADPVGRIDDNTAVSAAPNSAHAPLEPRAPEPAIRAGPPAKNKPRGGRIAYVNDSGEIVHADSISQVPEANRRAVIAYSGEGPRRGSYSIVPASTRSDGESAAVAPAPRPKAAIVYGAKWCKSCRAAEAWLTQRGVPIDVRDVDESATASAEFARYGGTAVPLIVIGDRVVRGFDQPALEAALKN